MARERLMLHTAAAAAGRKLVVSYPRMDAVEARPRVPSFYAMEVLRAAEGRLPDLRGFEKRAAASSPARLGWPAPLDARQAIDDAEYDLAALGPFRQCAARRGQRQGPLPGGSESEPGPFAAHARPALAQLLVRRRWDCRS